MNIAVTCNQCQKQYSIGEQFVGRAVRCKNCGATFVVQAPAANPAGSDLDWVSNDALGSVGGTTAGVASYGHQAPYQPTTNSPRAAAQKGMTTSAWSLKKDALIALAASGVVFLLLIVFAVLGIWYIGTHPVPGATREQRATSLGGGLGTLFGLLLMVPWIFVAIRHAQRREMRPTGQTSNRTQPFQTAGYGVGHTNAGRSPAKSNRNLWIGLGVGGGVFALLLVFGVMFVVSSVKQAARRAQARKMMQDPEWRERVLGEKQGWQMYTDASPVYGFSVELPNPPIKQHQGFTAGGTQWIVMAHRDKQTFSVVTLRPALGIDSEQAAQLLNSADVVATGMKARATSRRPITLGEFAGIEFDYESLSDQKPFSGRIRLFATSKMLFQVGWMASPREPVNADVARFLDSFQIPATAELPKPPVGLQMQYTPPPPVEFKARPYEELLGDRGAIIPAATP